jgi:hypothetical protein
MPTQVYFFTSIACSLIVWSIIIARSVWPQLRVRETGEALRPLLLLHSFRFMGLAFLVPGVVSPALPSAFAQVAAYGDLVAALLAFVAFLLLPQQAGIVVAWIFNILGTADLLNAFYQAFHSGLVPPQLGAAYFLPTFMVPLFLVTHVVMFRILLPHARPAVVRDGAWLKPSAAKQ